MVALYSFTFYTLSQIQSNLSQIHSYHIISFHWNTVFGKLFWIVIFQADQPEICVDLYTKMLHVNRAREPHVNQYSFISDTVLTQNHQRTEWNVAFHCNRVLGKFLWIVIFQADQPEICVDLYTKMLHINRAREPHVNQYSFISDTVLTQNHQRTEWNVAFHCNRVLGKFLWIVIFQADQSEICVDLYTKMLHINRAREPHVNQYSFISDTVLTQNYQRTEWNVAFHCNRVLCHCSTHCNVHGSRAATENCMQCDISLKHSFGQIIVNCHILSRSIWNLCRSIHQNAAR